MLFMDKNLGQKDELLPVDFISPDEGELTLIYGQIGSGKTTMATEMAIELARRGQIVYVTWPIRWKGFDERKSFKHLFFNTVFFRKHFFEFPSENIKYLDVFKDDIWETLSTLNNCHIFFDDVIVHLFDSYDGTKFDKTKRQWAFVTRHYDRSIYLVTQRPTQVQVALRSQVNRFYKCVKRMSWPFLILSRYEYQAMSGENVDESEEPVSSRTFFPSKDILYSFQSKNLRSQGIEPLYPKFIAYKLTLWDKIKALAMAVWGVFRRPKRLDNEEI